MFDFTFVLQLFIVFVWAERAKQNQVYHFSINFTPHTFFFYYIPFAACVDALKRSTKAKEIHKPWWKLLLCLNRGSIGKAVLRAVCVMPVGLGLRHANVAFGFMSECDRRWWEWAEDRQNPYYHYDKQLFLSLNFIGGQSECRLLVRSCLTYLV